jgi:hypothetical protein
MFLGYLRNIILKFHKIISIFIPQKKKEKLNTKAKIVSGSL